MISHHLKSLSILKSVGLFENINYFNQKLDLDKYYIIIAIIVSFVAPFFIFIPYTFAESSPNSSSSMINSTDVETLFYKANSLYGQQEYDEALEYYEKILTINSSNVDTLYNRADFFCILKENMMRL